MPLEYFSQLNSGDFLFIDSSHIIKPYGDIIFEYIKILPKLNTGVFIHIHDIFTPFDYPLHWFNQHNLFWNEQYVLESILANTNRYKVIFANNYMHKLHFKEFKTLVILFIRVFKSLEYLSSSPIIDLMKVLFLVRSDFFTTKGGVYVQINKTVEHLTLLGVECFISNSLKKVNLSNYDIIHLTDLTWVYDNLSYLRYIKCNFTGKIVLSTIYWSFDDYAKNGSPAIQRLIFHILGINGFEWFKSFAKLFTRLDLSYINGLFVPYTKIQKYISTNVDWLLPNAELEMKELNKRLGLNLSNYSVVSNSIDINYFDKIIESNDNIVRNNNRIACVGRIDSRKNQINFLKSIMNTDYEILFIGKHGPNSRNYYEKLIKLSNIRGNVHFLGHLNHDEIFKILLSSKAHILPSWVEMFCLVSLEAAYAGCNLVLTDKGSVREYFSNNGFYCQPNDLDSINRAVKSAMTSCNKSELRDYIRINFNWSVTAQQTLSAYKKIINS